MKKIILIIGAIIVSVAMLSGCNNIDLPEIPGFRVFEKQLLEDGDGLTQEGWNLVIFPEWAINACSSDSTPDVFASVLDNCGDILIMAENNGGWDSWLLHRPSNTLNSIRPNIEIHVWVENDCLLRIAE